jgi:hypothetical protein
VLFALAYGLVYGARNLAIQHVVPRASISIRSAQLFTDHGIVKAHVTGEVSGPERIPPMAVVRWSFTALPCDSDWTLGNRIDDLPPDQNGWISGMDNILDPGSRFDFNATWTPEDLSEWNQVMNGEECLYLVTKALYRDRFGPLPPKYSCSFFHRSTQFAEKRCKWGNR